MKATATLILTILTFMNSLGQNGQTNQLTKEGVKTGKWIEYDSNGKVISIKVYKAVKRKVSDEELFLSDGKVPSRYRQSDSTAYESQQTGKWITFESNGAINEIEYFDDFGYPKIIDHYSRNSSGLQVITRMSDNKTTYIIGDSDSLEFSNLTFYEIRPTNDFSEVKTLVKNISDSDVTFRVLEQDRLRVASNTYTIKTRDSIYLTIQIQAVPGQIDEVIKLQSNVWVLGLELRGFGYQLTTADFESNDKKIINKLFYYYRTNDEYQMEITNRGLNSKPKYIPLSKQFVEVNLDRGTYLFTIVGSSGRKSKEIEID